MTTISINLPTKPDKTVASAEFDLPIGGRVFRVKLTKTMNGVVDYDAEVTGEDGVPYEHEQFVRQIVVEYAKKHGAFEAASK